MVRGVRHCIRWVNDGRNFVVMFNGNCFVSFVLFYANSETIGYFVRKGKNGGCMGVLLGISLIKEKFYAGEE